MQLISLRRDTRAASLVEYIIVVAVVALVALVGYRVAGQRVQSAAQRDAACVASLDSSCATGKGGPASGPKATPASSASSETGTASAASTQSTPAVHAVASSPDRGWGYWLKGIPKAFGAEALDSLGTLAKLGFGADPVGLIYYEVRGQPNPAAEAVFGLVTIALHPRDTFNRARRIVRDKLQRDPADLWGRGGFVVASVALPSVWAKWAADGAKLGELAAEAGELERAAEAASGVADVARGTRTAEQLANAKALAEEFVARGPTATVPKILKRWRKGFEGGREAFRREEWAGARIPALIPDRTAQAFREAARFIENPKRIIPRLQELESEVLARSGTTADPLEAALSEMETRQGFAPVREVKHELDSNGFSQALRDGTPIRDLAFEGWAHGTQTHRIQWWALSREMESNPDAFANMSPPELYRSYGEYWQPSGKTTQNVVLWDETFDTNSSVPPGPWSPEWFREAQTFLPGLHWR